MKCSKCGAKMEMRAGKFGDFYFCQNSSPKDPHKTVSVKTKIEPDIRIMKVNPYTTLDVDQQIMNDIYSFGFKNDRIGNLAQFSLGPASDIDEGLDQWGYPEP